MTSKRNTIIGLSPMDGYTDPAFRFIVAKYGQPDIIYTEFVPAAAIARDVEMFNKTLIYSEIERPVIAQLFGQKPADFKLACQKIIDLGFDGIDINMGCPSKNINYQGAGASLINQIDLAREITEICREVINKNKSKIRLSIKTRLGYNEIDLTGWITSIASFPVENITLHGRTHKQGYSGTADWESIYEGARIIKNINPDITVYGNGDVQSRAHGGKLLEEHDLDGVLIGRACLGKPWIFKTEERPDWNKIKEIAILHAEKIAEYYPDFLFVTLRKHLTHYFTGHPDASKLRSAMVKVNNVEDVKAIMKDIC